MSETAAWIALAGLGAFHGLNPAMGWLFAVALGMHRQRGSAVAAALPPIALGHAAAIALVVALAVALSTAIELLPLQIATALLLVGWGVYIWLRRHRTRARIQVGFAELGVWSFLMATAHGAGVMLLPVILNLPATGGTHAGHEMPAAVGDSVGSAVVAVAIHTGAMLLVTGAIAYVVYRWVGLAFLRSKWINFDRIWSLALIASGLISLAAPFM